MARAGGGRFDLVVIGGGPAGLVAASGAAQLGARVALVERSSALGGDCLHHGCVPTKSLLRAASIAHLARGAAAFGVRVGGPAGVVEVDLAAVMARVRAVQATAALPDDPARFRALGVDVRLAAKGRFVAPDAFELAGPPARTLHARRFLIATGSRPVLPPIAGLAEVDALNNESVLRLERLPRTLVVLGGGPVGVELAQAYARLGARVTVIEHGPHLLSKEDPELADRLAAILRDEGIDVRTGVDVRAAARLPDGRRRIEGRAPDGAAMHVDGDELLVAAGRAPNAEDLGLEAAGVAVDPERGGVIMVDDRMRTTAPGIYAAGDVTGRFPFTHMAEHQASVVIANALFPPLPFARPRAASRAVPWVTYTDPELARCGATEAEARAEHGDAAVTVHRLELAAFDRAVIEGETRGLVKLVCGRRGRILGAHVLAPRGGEVLQEYVLAMAHGLSAAAIARAIHPYPTFAQAAKRAAEGHLRALLFEGRGGRVARALVRLGRALG